MGTPSRFDKIANLANAIEWRRDTPYFQNKMLIYDEIAKRLYQSQLKIEELERVLSREQSRRDTAIPA